MYAVSILIIFGALAGWIGIQHLARAFATRHPEFGPSREEEGGCGLFCLCRDRQSCPERVFIASDDGKNAERSIPKPTPKKGINQPGEKQ